MDKNVFKRGEFMDFMDAFLKRHPEVVEDQKRGWDIYWNPRKVDEEELNAFRHEEEEHTET